LHQKPYAGRLKKIARVGREVATLPKANDSKIDLFYVGVGKNIRDTRLAAGVSQTALAQQIGFNRSSIANLEAGRQRIALHLFFLIAEALDTQPSNLLPNMPLLEDADSATIENLSRHLVDALDTSQDFVRGTIAKATNTPEPRGGS
jgi:transcriptional regulator with XRE-family HTH domain